MDRKEALDLLELEEGANKTQIENKFMNMSRRIRNGENIDANKLREAYNFLTGYEEYNDTSSKLSKKYRKFMFNYSAWIILGIIVLLVISFVLVPLIFKRMPDLTISFVGKYVTDDLEYVEEYIKEALPELDYVLVEVIYLNPKGKSGEFESAGRAKLSGMLIAGDADIMIVDATTFGFLRAEGAIVPMDEILKEIGVDINKYKCVRSIEPGTGEKLIYGVVMNNNAFLNKGAYGDAEKVITIANRTSHIEEIKEALKVIFDGGK